MTKTTTQRLSKAGETLKSLESKGEETSAEDIRKARKKVKRAQRRLRSEKVASGKKDDMKASHEKNIEKAKGKEAKRKEAQESAVTKAAEKQAEADAKAKADEEAAKQAENATDKAPEEPAPEK